MLEFEWDPEKAKSNASKHGIAFEEAASVFSDTLSLTAYDPDHSQDEDRYITIGTSTEGQLLIISHADRNDCIRIISARPTTARERKVYENG